MGSSALAQAPRIAPLTPTRRRRMAAAALEPLRPGGATHCMPVWILVGDTIEVVDAAAPRPALAAPALAAPPSMNDGFSPEEEAFFATPLPDELPWDEAL